MMRRIGWLAMVGAILLAVPSVATSAEDAFFDDFKETIEGRWEVRAGEWMVKGGRLVHGHKAFPDHDFVIADAPFTDGKIEVKGWATKGNAQYRFRSLGIVIKYIDQDRYVWFRFGSYGNRNIDGRLPPGSDSIQLGGGQPDLGRAYDLTVIVRNGFVYLFIDDVMIGVIRDPYPGETGRPGLFSETGSEFDNFRVTELPAP